MSPRLDTPRHQNLFPVARTADERVIAECQIILQAIAALRQNDGETADFLLALPYGSVLPEGRQSFPPRA